MIGSTYIATNYRYGFNGKEKDDETYGTGNEYDYGARVYSPRLAKFLSLDPLTAEYPELTPYQFASNRPVQGIDRDGEEFQIVTGLIAGAVDYGSQVVANYAKGEEHPFTENISLTSIAGAVVEGALTSGASVGRRLLVKTTVAVVNNTIEVKTGRNGKGVTKSIETNIFNIVKNTATDLAVDAALGEANKLLGKGPKKIGVNTGNVEKTIKNTLKAGGKNITRQTNNNVKKITKVAEKVAEKTLETGTKGVTNNKKEEAKTNSDVPNSRTEIVSAKF